MAENIATHNAPAWRSESNYVVIADLSPWGLPGHWEQLWARQVDKDEFVLCCIPFFTYGLALGDRVRTRSEEHNPNVISSVISRSGHRVVRIWLKGVDETGRAQIERFVNEQRLLHEWSSSNLLALDVPGDPEVVASVDEFVNIVATTWPIVVESGE